MKSRGPLVLAAAIVAGLVARVAFVLAQPASPFDPWRHRQLVDNLRDGLGFTLFEGQPYLWYNPLWYRLCSLLTDGDGMRWVALGCSLACIPLAWRALRERGAEAAAWAAGLTALLGPLVIYTCHDGSEALALACVFGALALDPERSRLRALLAGLTLGLALTLRMNLLFNVFLFYGLLRRPWRALPFAVGAALPLVAHLGRQIRILGSHEWVYSWDGLALRSATFDWDARILLQRHPDIAAALRTLHDTILPQPEWLARWDLLLLLAVGLSCVVVSRNVGWLLAAFATAGYFLLLDGTHSAYFFRLWVALFPALILAAACLAGSESARPWLQRLPAIGLLLLGVGAFAPQPMTPLPASTAPAVLVEDAAYFVNSGRYHPEALIRVYPDARFLGLPWREAELDAYLAHHAEVDRALWHDFDLQPQILAGLMRRGWRVEAEAVGGDGRRYRLLRRPERVPR